MDSLRSIPIPTDLIQILIIFLMFLFIPFLLKIADVGKIKLTGEYLIYENEKIPWSQIARVFLKQSEWNNPYLAFYFEDDTPPKSVEITYYSKQSVLIYQLRAKAAEKGFTFVEEAVKLKDDVMAAEEFQELKKEMQKPEIRISSRQKLILEIGLAVAFFLWIYFVFGAEFVIPILIIVFIHEGGHFIALRLLHMKTKGLIFIPFFGAGVIPGDEFASPRTEVAVALAGPAAGLSVNVVGHFFSNPFDLITSFLRFPSGGILSLTIILNLAINLLNLMPILPLDGGRVMRAALLRGKKSLILVAIVTVGGALAAGIWIRSILLLLVAALGAISLYYSYTQIKKHTVAPPSWWETLVVLGAWIGVIFLYWYTLPSPLKEIIEMLWS